MSKRTAGLHAKAARTKSTKKSNNALKKGSSSTHENMDGRKDKPHYRDASTIRRLKLYDTKPDLEAMKKQDLAPKRIAPSRKYFDNARVVSQDKLEQFRAALLEKKKDPMKILTKRTRLPISLFDHSGETPAKRASNLLAVEPFEKTFCTKAGSRKRPRLQFEDAESLAETVHKSQEEFDEQLTEDEGGKVCMPSKASGFTIDPDARSRKVPLEPVMLKGTSKRIWAELYKVIDSSDIIVQVLDARDPMGTRCRALEKSLAKDHPFKHMILLLNKCDLIPTWATDKWVSILSKEYPTIAFKASLKHPFGKRAMINLLRQYAEMMKNRKHVSVGFVGFPNVGKSSAINTMVAKKACNAAPIPGETKVWQYIALTSRVYLIDCPGVVTISPDMNASHPARTNVNKVLRGVVRSEKLETPEEFIPAIVALVGEAALRKRYKLTEDDSWSGEEELLELLARKWGKLRKGGEAELSAVAKVIINDLQRGKLPWFINPDSVCPEKPSGKKAKAAPDIELEPNLETQATNSDSDKNSDSEDATEAGSEQGSDGNNYGGEDDKRPA